MEPDFYDIRTLEATTRSITLDNGEIREVEASFTWGVCVRALVDGCWGVATNEDPGKTRETLKTAVKLAEQTRGHREPFKLAPPSQAPSFSLPPVLKNPEDVSLEEKIEFLGEVEKAARLEKIKNTTLLYMESQLKVGYQSSDGADLEYTLTRTGFAVSAVAMENGDYQLGRESRFAISGMEIFDRFNARELAQKAARTAQELLEAKTARGGSFPVILDPELAGVFIHEAVGHAAEADHVLDGISILAGKIKEKVASNCVTVYDDPTLHEYGYYPFDDEGSSPTKTPVIKKGILENYLHSRETQAKLGGRPGNSRAQGLLPPQPRMSNTYIENGNSSFEELLEELKDGIYLLGSRGGQVNPGEGVFQFNAERGFLVEKGEITTPLRDVSLSGETLDILQKIELVGNDLELHQGRCGKNGQLVPVSDGSPHILVSKALVGGRG